MDAAGKDGTIKHVMSGVNPQGCQVFSFKKPSAEELDHNFLWRYMKAPARARPDRHLQPLLLRRRAGREGAPGDCSSGRSCRRASAANRSGRSATRTSTPSSSTWSATARVILKFFLNVSKDEQKKRFLERLDDPEKHWKFSAADLAERALLGRLHGRLRGRLSATSTEWAPWYVIPADHKWVARAAWPTL